MAYNIFKNLRKCLDDFENVLDKLDTRPFPQPTSEDRYILDNFNLHFADALIRDYNRSACGKIAKIILTEVEEE